MRAQADDGRSRVGDEHSAVRDEHSAVRDEHSAVRDEHSAVRDEHSLDGLERWFQDEIVRPHESASKGAKRDGPRAPRAQDWILPSRHLRPKERLDIYSRMYLLRLHDCLSSDYPAVARLCGEQGFERLVRAYLRHHPSRHYSLNVLGRHLPEFLAGDVRIPRRALIADVARLELAMSQVFDAPQSRVLTPADLALVSAAAWEDAHPRLIDAFQVHAFDHRVNAIINAVRRQENLPNLGRAQTWVAIYRKEFVVWRMDLTEPMYAVLHALHERRSLRDAIEDGARSFEGTPEQLQTHIFGWFAEWASEGFFSAIESA